MQEALGSSDPARVRAALEILVAWERAIPLEKLCDFLEHRDREIRLLAFRLASFVAIDSDSRLALLRALVDADTGARRLAIVAVGRQKITEADPCARTLPGERGAGRGAPGGVGACGDAARRDGAYSTNRAPARIQSTKLAAEEALARARKVS